MDFITGLPPSGPDLADTMMVITVWLSKSIILEPMTTITAATIAKRILDCVIRYPGIPSAIVSDRGPQFVSLIWKRICDLLKITRRLSIVFYPEIDGATERANQKVKHYLRYYATYWQYN
jgi:transposase InsO family protein